MKGWISLHRKILENPILTFGSKYSRIEAFLWLLMKVNHKEARFLHGNVLTTVKKGETLTSQKQLMKQFGWGNSRLRSYLKLLELDGMIKVKAEPTATRITVLNYSTYQESQIEAKSEATRKQPKANPKPNTNNNENKKNNVNNVNKENIIDFDKWYGLYPKKVGREVAFNSFCKLKPKEKLDALKGLILYNQYWISEATQMKYIPNPSTFLNQKRFNDELGDSKKDVGSDVREKKRVNAEVKYKQYVADNTRDSASQDEVSKILKQSKLLKRRV